ncbi:MAG: phosphoribosyltransferase, partial [Alphaproteobacteria bacterium]|nr:phosphoribosyltransferase [Alphaproteobacteria bacterium]
MNSAQNYGVETDSTTYELYLGRFREPNSDLFWRPNDTVVRIGLMAASRRLGQLSDSGITLLPVISWPTNPLVDSAPTKRKEMKTEIVSKAQRVAAGINRSNVNTAEVYTGVAKINYTNRSSPKRSGFDGKTSFFAGEIESGKTYVLVDDRVDTGSTVRDLWRYVESQGGKVVAVVETSSNHPAMELNIFPSDEFLAEKFFPVLWGSTQKDIKTREQAQKKYVLLDTETRKSFESEMVKTANQYLEKLGLNFAQLTSGEVNRISEMFVTADMEPLLHKHIDKTVSDLWDYIGK